MFSPAVADGFVQACLFKREFVAVVRACMCEMGRRELTAFNLYCGEME